MTDKDIPLAEQGLHVELAKRTKYQERVLDEKLSG